ncbi:MAG: hypothetical protein IJX65_07775 [Alistipes sp.]|nr:hypothetical protein [Alistipes sp.]
MRKIVLTLFIIIGTLSASAQSLLDTLSESLAAMGRYEARVQIAIDDYSLAGGYIVEGTDFYAYMDGVELYVADGVKYEVNSRKGEVTIDTAQSLGSDIVSNPAQGFALLKEQFVAKATTVSGAAAVELTPKAEYSEQYGGQSVTVVADSSGKLPAQVIYREGSSSLTVRFLSVAPYQRPLPRFDSEKYAQYELLDMR